MQLTQHSIFQRTLLPLAGIAVTIALVAQVRSPGADIPSLLRASDAPVVPDHAGAPMAEVRVFAEGRLVAYPGAEIHVGVDLTGTLERVLVEERSTVRRGDLLAELRADDIRAEYAEAQARLAEVEADVRLERAEFDRIQGLFARGLDSELNLDRARRDLDATGARRDVAAAAVRRLEATLAKTRILSPIQGTVVSRRVDAGETVEVGAHLFTVADLTRLRVELEVDEYDAGRVQVGDAVRITAEGYEGASWSGVVEEIPDQVVTRGLTPRDPGRPSDTRVLLVKVALREPHPLKLDQRVEALVLVPGGRR